MTSTQDMGNNLMDRAIKLLLKMYIVPMDHTTETGLASQIAALLMTDGVAENKTWMFEYVLNTCMTSYSMMTNHDFNPRLGNHVERVDFDMSKHVICMDPCRRHYFDLLEVAHVNMQHIEHSGNHGKWFTVHVYKHGGLDWARFVEVCV
jgi:hypothetical protein